MRTEMLMKKVNGTLRPVDEASYEIFNKLPNDKIVVVVARRSRNPDFLKRYWAVARVVARFDKEFDSEADADWWARMSIPSMREEIRLSDERIGVRLKSIALDQMDEGPFEEFYSKAVELWSMRLGTDVETLLREAA